jgi:hypothetical protein
MITDELKERTRIFLRFEFSRYWRLSCRKLTMQTGEGEIVNTSNLEAKGFGYIKPDTGETCDGW